MLLNKITDSYKWYYEDYDPKPRKKIDVLNDTYFKILGEYLTISILPLLLMIRFISDYRP